MSKATDIPDATRKAVHARDGGLCRVCGAYASSPALHHIVFRSQERNNHSVDNLVTLGAGYGHTCHQAVHAHNSVFADALKAIVNRPNLTALTWLRREGVDIRGLLKGNL